MKLTRAKSIRFELPDGRTITVAPPSIAQVQACLALDPAEPGAELPAARLLRVAAQLETLLGEQASLVDSLTFDEATQMLCVIFCHMAGYDPADLEQARAFLARQPSRRAQDVISTLDEVVLALATLTRTTPAAAEQTPLLDAAALLARQAREREQQAKFDAALHDKTLR